MGNMIKELKVRKKLFEYPGLNYCNSVHNELTKIYFFRKQRVYE